MRPLIRMYPRTVIVASITLIAIFLSAGLLVAQIFQSFRITSIQRSNNDVRITWDAPAGSNYSLQYSTKLGATNFTDLAGPYHIPGSSVVATNYTHLNALLNSTSRFYRVRSFFAPPILHVYPVNAVIGITMTNRYKVLADYPDGSTQDVTVGATFTTLGGVAQTVGLSADGFAQVQGTSSGTGSVRAVYQGVTNTVTVTVAQLTGIYTVPPLSQLNSYVGVSNNIKVMGVFSNGQTNNITPSSNVRDLSGDPVTATRVDYVVTADVANSYALITGQSAATGSAMIVAPDLTPITFGFSWCWFTSVTLQPQNSQLTVGQVQPFSVIGHMANGSNVNAFDYSPSFQAIFSSDDDSRAQANSSDFTVTAVAPGTTAIHVNVYNGPGSPCLIGLDDSTSVTVISPPSTTVLWTNGYNGPGNKVDQAVAIALDPGGNPAITGNSYGGVGSDYDYVTIRYSSSSGAQSWVRRFSGGSGADMPVAIATDLNSNVFVTGYTVVSGNYDWATIKYSVSGTPSWTNRYNGPANGLDEPSGIAVDTNGNVFVAGWASSASSIDFATIKYSGAGMPLWTNYYNGPGNNTDESVAIALNRADDVFVTGFSTAGNGFSDYATIKYSNSGTPLWTNRFNGPSNMGDSPVAMAVDPNDNVFVTGDSYNNGSADDYVTIEYSNAGTPLWTNTYNGTTSGYDAPAAIAVDNKGDVIVTGSSNDSNNHRDCVTIKYAAAGTPVWTNRYNGSVNGNDYGRSVAVDSSRDVVVAGYSDFGTYSDLITIKYSSGGNVLKFSRYGGGVGSATAIDSSKNIFVTGSGTNINTYYDCVILKYAP